MLEHLRIIDFAVARSVEICPGPGLNVFTGETGAGKSLVVDALAFVLGARRGREVIAGGAVRATVSATIALGERQIRVERSIGAAGRSAARIDGGAATLDELQALAATAVDIHGQSDHLAILRPQEQLLVLDSFAELLAERDRLAGLVRELRAVRRRIVSLSTDARERERLAGQLEFELEEIGKAGLVAGEDETLRTEAARLGNAGRLIEDVAAALAGLDQPGIGEAVRASAALAARDPGAAEIADNATLLESAALDLERALRRYREQLEEDPERLATVQERLDFIARLRRKYGETVADILVYAGEARARLESLAGEANSVEALRDQEVSLIASLGPLAARLSAERRSQAGRLVEAVRAELEHLGMGRATLTVGFSCDDALEGLPVPAPDYEMVFGTPEPPPGSTAELHRRAFSESGVDRLEFLASFNLGEPPRPLSAVASGGETSRFFLALTAVLGASAEPRIVVFDEVDEGVGGRAGALVGEALARLAERHQVLCVTHLPQVAALGSRHFVVTKQADASRTWSEVREVSGEERIEELAEMLGGKTEATLAAARELLDLEG